jgi:hypothetical protein
MWFSLSSQVISDPECTGLQRSVCQGDAIADIIPAYHRKIASLETHHDRSEVVRRRELPILVHGDHGLIARMIVTPGARFRTYWFRGYAAGFDPAAAPLLSELRRNIPLVRDEQALGVMSRAKWRQTTTSCLI